MIKAIETEWKGYRFRSRLEARWAVFFDAMGYDWKYEHQGYEANGVRYLPDFELHFEDGRVFFVEVKGKLSNNDCQKMAAVLDFCSPLPGFEGSWLSQKSGLLMLGDIPDASDINCHPTVYHHKGLHLGYSVFAPSGLIRAGNKDCLLTSLHGLNPKECIEGDPSKWSVATKPISVGFMEIKCAPDAYRKARQARFEHGEQP